MSLFRRKNGRGNLIANKYRILYMDNKNRYNWALKGFTSGNNLGKTFIFYVQGAEYAARRGSASSMGAGFGRATSKLEDGAWKHGECCGLRLETGGS
jgi:hypothetical protein